MKNFKLHLWNVLHLVCYIVLLILEGIYKFYSDLQMQIAISFSVLIYILFGIGLLFTIILEILLIFVHKSQQSSKVYTILLAFSSMYVFMCQIWILLASIFTISGAFISYYSIGSYVFVIVISSLFILTTLFTAGYCLLKNPYEFK